MIRILFFAQTRAAGGVSELFLSVDEAPDVDSLWRYLLAAYPLLDRFKEKTRISRNAEFVRGNERFSDGDEIALIPPVSGG